MYRSIFLFGALLLFLADSAHSTDGRGDPFGFRSAYGGAAAIVGDDVFIAEPSGFSTPGMVHVYQKDSEGRWAEIQTLLSSDSDIGDRFGSSIAGDGRILLVGATAYADGSGIVYVFEKKADGTWTQSSTLRASETVPGDSFGASVGIQGDWAVVTSPGRNARSGAATVFKRSGDAWMEIQTLEAGSDGTDFGASLGMTEKRVAIGAPGLNENNGGVFIFEMDDGTGVWHQTGLISDPDETGTDRFGSSIALGSGIVAVGAPLANQFTGRVEMFTSSAEGWSRKAGVTPTAEEGVRRGIGSTIALDGDRIWVSAPFDGFRMGTIVSYGPEFDDATLIHSPDAVEGSAFGSAISIDGSVAVVGMPGHDYGEGVAAIFEKSGESWSQAALVYRDLSSHMAVRNDRTDCADGIAKEFECSNVDLVAFIPNEELGLKRGVRLNDVWGWTDPQTGKEYGLIANMENSIFVDLSVAESPVILGTLPRTEGSPGSTWRDIKVYNDHAFIVADGAREHGMQVFDLARLRDVENPPVVFEPDAMYHGIASAHNIVIDEESGFAYTVGGGSGGDTCGGALHMINIQDPVNPTFVGCFVDKTTGRGGSGATHDAQCVVYDGPDAEHRGKEICIGSNGTAISIADVTDKDRPVPISTGTYPNSAYVHQGWLTDDHAFFYQNDEADENRGVVDKTRTMIWDVRDLDEPEMIGEFFGPTNSTDHNLYVNGDYMYQANNASGLRIIDIRDRTNPVEVGYFDTTPNNKNVAGFDGTWSNYPFFESGMILLTSRREGLFIVKKRELDI